MPFDTPRGPHLDAWGLALMVVCGTALLMGETRRWSVLHHWRHHPFRMVIERHLANALLAASVLLAISAVTHLAGVPVYDVPLMGASALAVFAATLFGGVLMWRARFIDDLAAYDRDHPQLASADARLPHVKPSAELPYWVAGVIGFVAYVAFVWHPWNHVFHEGNLIIGAVGGFAIGSVIAMHTALIPRPPQPRGAARHKHGR